MSELIEVAGYRLDSMIGRGGNGVVWRGVSTEAGAPVAVKLLRIGRAHKPHAFFHEAQALARLNHPLIVRILDIGMTGHVPGLGSGVEVPFIVMEHVHGKSLQDLLDSVEPRGLFETLNGLLAALSYAHARGIVHRDVKPGNILLSEAEGQFELRLVDFGLAFGLEEPTAEVSSKVEGTPAYMAPEQIRGEHREIGPWTDLYAVGCLAWAVATGSSPFRASTTEDTLTRHLRGDIDPFVPRMELPSGFEDWVRALLARSPYARFQRAVEARSALTQLEMPSGPWLAADRHKPDDEDNSGAATVVNLAPTTTVISVASDLESWSSPEIRVPRSVAVPADWRDLEIPTVSWTSGRALLRLFALREVELVGRERHRDQLWDCLLKTIEVRKPNAALLKGPYGIGKSRLARWLAERAHEACGAEVIVTRHGPREDPAAGLARIAATSLRCDGLAGLPLAERVGSQLERLGVRPDTLDFVTYVVVWLIENGAPSYKAAPEVTAEGPGPEEQIGAMVELVRALARRRPLVLWLDDLHDGPTTARFVDRLLGSVRGAPIMVVGTVVQMPDEPCPRHVERLIENHPSEAKALDVARLPDRDIAALVEAMVDPEERTLEQVIQRADGSPLFAVELVNDWAGSGALAAGPHGRLVLDRPDSVVPEGLSEIWEARLDAALEASTADPEAGRRALELGAALGSRVRNTEWDLARRRLGGLPVDTMLEELIRRELIVALPEGWRFRHQLLRNAIIEGAKEARRWDGHHAICADVLAEMYSPDRRGIAARRAEHLLESHHYRDALEALWNAFREIRIFGEIERCEELLRDRERACDALQLPENDYARVRNLLIARSVGRPYPPDGKWSGWLEQAADLGRANEYHELLAQALRGLANIKLNTGECAAAVALYDKSLEALDRAGDAQDPIDRMYALVQRGTALHRAGNAGQALQSMAKASAIARELGPIYEARTRFEMVTVSLLDGRLKHARWLIEQAFEMLKGTHNQRIEGVLTGRLGDIERAAGNFKKAREHYRRVEMLQQNGVEVFRFDATLKFALLSLAEGDPTGVEQLCAATTARHEPMWTALDLLSDDPEVVSRARETIAAHPESWLQFDVDAQFLVHSGVLNDRG